MLLLQSSTVHSILPPVTELLQSSTVHSVFPLVTEQSYLIAVGGGKGARGVGGGAHEPQNMLSAYTCVLSIKKTRASTSTGGIISGDLRSDSSPAYGLKTLRM